MTVNAKMGRLVPGPSQGSLFAAGGEADTKVPRLPAARPVVVVTAGRIEYAARCPQCRDWHRHVSLGEKRAPCGAVYELQPRRGRVA
ncbi:hypothetical protein QMK19_30580 [Streptomyces sp. H10-C2]|uniref:hypothetical protein n=1 Tax=unclassified Streptomyces TaxID=2593676 RepID=UPI0024B8E7FF|nr:MULTISPECIES: hypothetical protein [unclassified Streptomyces]MDJ0345953.1 hypothetical protein [Streptomyces sp. PH10-H1]MDJ0373880.1 hypothetical protein [Streptomyces sp. H10-C2]